MPQDSSFRVGSWPRLGRWGLRSLGIVLILLAFTPAFRLLDSPGEAPFRQTSVAVAEATLQFAWWGTILTLLTAALLALLLPTDRLRTITQRFAAALCRPSRGVWAGVLAAVGTTLAACVAFGLFGGLLTNVDEFATVLHARYLAHGLLAGPTFSLPEFWLIPNTLVVPEGWVSQYPPTHLLALAAMERLGIPLLLGPLAFGAMAGFVALSLMRLMPEHPAEARIASLLVATCPLLFFLGGGLLTHVTTGALIGATLYAVLRARDGSAWWAVAAGGTIGLAVADRPLVGLVLGTVFTVGVWAPAGLGRRPLRLRWLSARVAGTAAGGLPIAILLGWFNQRLFGSPLTLGYLAAFGDRHRLGFHVDPWGSYYGLSDALAFTSSDVLAVGVQLLETPFPATALIGVALLSGVRLSRSMGLLLAWAFLPVLANGYYWFHSARMLFEAAPAWVALYVLAAAYLARPSEPGQARRLAVLGRDTCAWALALGTAFAVGWNVPARWSSYAWDPDTSGAHHPAAPADRPALHRLRSYVLERTPGGHTPGRGRDATGQRDRRPAAQYAMRTRPVFGGEGSARARRARCAPSSGGPDADRGQPSRPRTSPGRGDHPAHTKGRTIPGVVPDPGARRPLRHGSLWRPCSGRETFRGSKRVGRSSCEISGPRRTGSSSSTIRSGRPGRTSPPRPMRRLSCSRTIRRWRCSGAPGRAPPSRLAERLRPREMSPVETRARGRFEQPGPVGTGVRLSATTAIGLFGVALIVRAFWLGLPIRYDEAFAYLHYSARGAVHVLTRYDKPNNHVLHSLLVAFSTGVFGSAQPWAVRVPALLAGSAVPVASAWLALRVYGRSAAVLTAAMTGLWPALIELLHRCARIFHGRCARRRSGVIVIGLAERPSWRRAAGLGALGAVGLFAVPVMAIPLLGLEIFLLQEAWHRESAERQMRLRDVLTSSTIALGLAAAAYLPIVLNEGAASLIANKYVAPRPWTWFLRDLPGDVLGVTQQWLTGVPLGVVLVVSLGLVADQVLKGERRSLPPLAPVLLGSIMFVLLRRNTGFSRIWLFLLPFVLVSAAGGLSHLLDRSVQLRSVRSVSGVAALIGAALAWGLVTDRPLVLDTETGAFPEGEVVARFLADEMGRDDELVTDAISREPIEFYLRLRPRRGPTPNGASRTWLVVQTADTTRCRRAIEAAEQQTVALERVRGVREFGTVRVGVDAPLPVQAASPLGDWPPACFHAAP